MSQPNGAKRASHNNKVGAGDVGVSQQSVASSPLNLGHTSNLAKCKHLLLEKLEALKAKQLLNHSLKMQVCRQINFRSRMSSEHFAKKKLLVFTLQILTQAHW
jgi:hypothetical protein